MTISAQCLSFQWPNGQSLFTQLNLNLNPGMHGLVGANGCGKSTLLRLLAGNAATPPLLSSGGSIDRQGRIAYVAQQDTHRPAFGADTLADYLGIQQRLEALQRIYGGSVEQRDFELVGDDWQFAEHMQQQLQTLGLWWSDASFERPISSLSGGQLMRLRLFKALSDEPTNLLLDEPSNHLDTASQRWLSQRCRDFVAQPGRCLLVVSHDRQLLRQVDSISELNTLGLQYYHGNYDAYRQQQQQQQAAAERELKQAEQQRQRVQRQQQRELEKAQRRQARAQANRANAGQAKVMLDFAKNRAQQHRQALSTRHLQQTRQTQQRLAQAQAQIVQRCASYVSLATAAVTNAKRLLHAVELRLPFIAHQAIDLTLTAGDKRQLCGANGSGKSTLLKVLAGQLQARAGKIQRNVPIHFCDQHYAFIDSASGVLQNLCHYRSELSETEARTALAGIGLRGEAVFRTAAELSGGETMKLAMLMMSATQQAGVLLLDEPDNHLDLIAKQQLAAAIKDYPGALLLVSHDQDFIADTGITQQLSL